MLFSLCWIYLKCFRTLVSRIDLASPFVPLLPLMYKKALISTISNCAVVNTCMDALRVRRAFPILIAFESTYYVVHKLHKVANDYFSLFPKR